MRGVAAAAAAAALVLGLVCGLRAPVAVNTWAFTHATDRAYSALASGAAAVDAVTVGCRTCQELQCDGTVGFGGSPDENGETTLDALVMDGTTLGFGAVGALRRVKDVVGVARKVMEHTRHSVLVGDQATEFAKMMGFPEELLNTSTSDSSFESWKKADCQPNYWVNVEPDNSKSCGPYAPAKSVTDFKDDGKILGHDTISMLALDVKGNIAVATSSNGANHKIPGRVGDAAIPGAGGYADSEVGACGATGDGDVMMRLLPCYQAIESMRLGVSPQQAAEDVIRRIGKRFPDYKGAVVVLSKDGQVGAAGWGWTFVYSYHDADSQETKVVSVKPITIA